MPCHFGSRLNSEKNPASVLHPRTSGGAGTVVSADDTESASPPLPRHVRALHSACGGELCAHGGGADDQRQPLHRCWSPPPVSASVKTWSRPSCHLQKYIGGGRRPDLVTDTTPNLGQIRARYRSSHMRDQEAGTVGLRFMTSLRNSPYYQIHLKICGPRVTSL